MGFKEYLINQYQDVPTVVYKGLILILVIGFVLIITVKGYRGVWRQMGKILFVEYICFLYCSTVLYRHYIHSPRHHFSPFWSYQAIQSGREDLIVENILNVMVFIPLGVSLGWSFRNVRWWQVLLVSLCISISIETMQFVMNRGFAEFDDVIHNALGCIIGFGIVCFAKKVWYA